MARNILLVGGNGYLGRGMTPSFEALGYSVESWDIPREIRDLTPKDLVSRDFVVNLAVIAENESSRGLSHASRSWQTNVEGLASLLNACKQAEKTLIHFSTREAHARTLRAEEISSTGDFYRPKLLIDENVPFSPTSPYGRSKLISEWLCEASERCFVVRLGTPYTDETPLTGGGLMATLIRKAIGDGHVTLDGGGRQFRDPLHVRDISDLVVRIASTLPEEKVFNAGGGPRNVISLREIVLLANPDCMISESAGGDLGFAMNVSLAEEKLGWTPKVDVRDEIKRFVRAYSL